LTAAAADVLPYVFAALAVNVAGYPGRIVGQPAMKPTVLAGRFIVLLLVSVALAATFVHANQSTNPPKWWTSETYKRDLGLTADQSRKLEDIFQAAAPALRTQRKALEDAEAQFEKLVTQADDKAVIDQINRVVSARADLNRSHSIMLFRMRRVLTPEQWTKLGTLTEREKQKAVEKPK
jgi:Spy/CpxP family protein refolding chaperone